VIDELLEWRPEFPILERSTYLISHSLGAMPRSVSVELKNFTDMWANRGVRAWSEGWWDMPLTVGDEVGRIIGAPAGTVVMHQNVSLCLSIVLSCLEADKRRNKIVYTDLEFPSLTYVIEAWARTGDFKTHVVRSSDGMTIPTEDLLAAIDDETLFVPFSHVLFKSSYMQDAQAIVRKCQSVGAYSLLDAYQSAGIVPLNVKEMGVDFCTGGSVKWLCGGPGAGYLYVRPELIEKLEPKVTGWMAHETPFGFEQPPIRYKKGIYRFLHGSPSIPALYSARSGYRIINKIGVERIREKSRRQTSLLINLAREHGFEVMTPLDPERRGGTVTLKLPHMEAVAAELLRREILVDFRPLAGIRLSPHFYTTDDEIERALSEISTILFTSAYTAHNPSKVVF
jgi:kynureninase